MERRDPGAVDRRAVIVRDAGRHVFDAAATHRFEEALQALALEVRLALDAHQSAISYVPLGEFRDAVHTHSLSEKYARYRSYDMMPTGQGLWSLVVHDKRPLRLTTEEVFSHPSWRSFSGLRDARGLEHPPLRGWLAAPLIGAGGELLGSLQLSDKLGDAEFTDADLDWLVVLAKVIAPAFELHHANQELALRTEDLRRSEAQAHALLRTSRNLEQAQTDREAIDAVVVAIREVLGWGRAWVYLLTSSREHADLFVDSVSAARPREMPARLSGRGDPYLEAIAEATGVVVLEDARSDPRTNKELVERTQVRTVVNVPMFVMDRKIGILTTATFGDEGVQPPSTAQIDFLTSLASHLATTLARLQLIAARSEAEAERRRLEAQLQHAQKLESLGVLAGGIAHDFNNLLTSILGYADLALQELPAASPARSLIDETVKGARQAAELTTQMLAYSGKGRFVVEAIDLSALVQDMTRLLQISISKKCLLRFNLMPELPAIDGDAAQIRQIVMNLVINASEAVGDRSGAIVLSTGVMHCDRAYLSETYLDDDLPEGLYVHLEVADTGCGIAEDVRDRLFDPFFTTKFTGRGLGLSAVLGIVRGHRGAIKVYGEPDKGSTFKVLFPPSLAAATPPGPIAGEAIPWRGHGTILVVDDEESVRGLARRMLETMGFSVLTAADGRDAVSVFAREGEHIDLVLLDMTMPHLDGEETFRELRRLRADVRTVLCSGYNEQTATGRFAGKGLTAFLQKPYRYEELLAVVRAAMNGGSGRTA